MWKITDGVRYYVLDQTISAWAEPSHRRMDSDLQGTSTWKTTTLRRVRYRLTHDPPDALRDVVSNGKSRTPFDRIPNHGSEKDSERILNSIEEERDDVGEG